VRKYFHISELQQQMQRAWSESEAYERMYTFKLNNLKELIGRLPNENEAFFIETKKSFSAFTFIVYLMKHSGVIHHLYIATYSTNERIIKSLVKWHEQNKIEHIHLFIAENIRNRMPTVYEKLLKLEADGVISLTFAWSHKKVTAIHTDDGYFVVEGSGNYGENAMIENYVFIKSKRIYDFRTRLNEVGE